MKYINGFDHSSLFMHRTQGEAVAGLGKRRPTLSHGQVQKGPEK
jgi:hypothetical protein